MATSVGRRGSRERPTRGDPRLPLTLPRDGSTRAAPQAAPREPRPATRYAFEEERTLTPDFDRFFREYAEVFNRSLGESVDVDGIREAFADCFVGAGPSGVTCGRNDASFA